MSIWNKDNNFSNKFNFDTLTKDITTDVCVIGGGLTGISTCYLLNNENIDFCLVEKDKIMSKTSSHSTAKITFQHNLIYRYLIDSYGFDFAKGYYLSNKEGLENIIHIIEKEKINCDLKREDNYIYTTNKENITKLKDEASALNMLGINCEILDTVPLPLPNIVCALKVSNQASFNPVKYTYGLINTFYNKNSKSIQKLNIFENTCVIGIKKAKTKDKYIVITEKGNKIYCNHVVMATKYPIKDIPGFHFLKMYQETSYIVAISTNKEIFEGMYISCDMPSLSFRKAKYKNKDVLLIGGNSHKTGDNLSLKDSYTSLINCAKSIYPDLTVIDKWNTEDTISLDKIPYIGKFSCFMKNLYIATGFKKWGITTSNVSSKIITDMITKKNNPYIKIYNSTRFKPIKNRKELFNMVKQASSSMLINKFKIKHNDNNIDVINTLKNDCGKIIKINGNLIGIYKDKNSKIYAVSPICSHLGCLLHFNDLDKTWDCPCHGSRFDFNGKNLYNPASKNLEVIDIERIITK